MDLGHLGKNGKNGQIWVKNPDFPIPA